MDLMDRYNLLKEKVRERGTAFAALMRFVETQTDYLRAPASTRFHLCRDRGLLEHSVNVAETLLRLRETLATHISQESCVIVALLHDLGKAGTAGQALYLPARPAARQVPPGPAAWPPYQINREAVYLSVPLRSLYLTLPYLPLTPEEAQAIAYHDGQYVEDNRSAAARERPLTLLLQYADNWCGFVLENYKETRSEIV